MARQTRAAGHLANGELRLREWFREFFEGFLNLGGLGVAFEG